MSAHSTELKLDTLLYHKHNKYPLALGLSSLLFLLHGMSLTLPLPNTCKTPCFTLFSFWLTYLWPYQKNSLWPCLKYHLHHPLFLWKYIFFLTALTTTRYDVYLISSSPHRNTSSKKCRDLAFSLIAASQTAKTNNTI